MTDKLDSENEILFRQVHPNWVVDGLPTSQAFTPTPKDDNKLSSDRESLTTAEASHVLHTVGKSLQSEGSWGVTVGEYAAHTVSCYADPLPETEGVPENKAHVFADYGHLSVTAQGKVGRKIKRNAIERGRLFPPL